RSSGAVPFNVHARCAAKGTTEKLNQTSACTGDCAAIGNDSGAGRGRAVEEVREAAACAADCAAVVDDSGAARGRAVDEKRVAAACAADCAAVVGKGAMIRCRGVEELRGAAACAEQRGTVVGEGSPCPRRRAAKELYYPLVATSINSSHKILCDSGKVGDAR